MLQEQGLALVRDGGAFVGVQPSAKPDEERGITVDVVVAHPDGPRLGDLIARAASGELPARVHAVMPLDQVTDDVAVRSLLDHQRVSGFDQLLECREQFRDVIEVQPRCRLVEHVENPVA